MGYYIKRTGGVKADTLRSKFLDFFKSKKHKIVESDSLVPKDDPTVLFTPAGMNQFKRQFLGDLSCGYSRAATSQRCLRTDDLDKVGKTPVHHTFFEMLGNFSFGDYFKDEAIAWAWEFLTEELKIDPEKLWVSVYTDDSEAYAIWKGKIKIPGHKIIKLGDKENFWPSEAKEKGPNGPCGPCSEIFFDFGSNVGCKKPDCGPACGCGRFSEVWNLVFTQFNRREDGALTPLPKKNIDTGMGLERLAAVMQGVGSNFETDLFKPLVEEIKKNAAGLPNKKTCHAVADHIRAVVFSVYDGIMPSNEGRGYVVRKIIRKALLHLKSAGVKKPFLYKLVPIVAQTMKAPYPDLEKQKEDIAAAILEEEKNFIRILDSSNELLKKGLAGLMKVKDTSEAASQKAGGIAFQLHDTYGIPWELTKDFADIHGIKISQEEFEKQLNRQKERSKSRSAMKGDVFAAQDFTLGLAKTKFLGYKECAAKAKITRILKDGSQIEKAKAGDEVRIILDKTPFYPESGGQIGDTGNFIKGKNVFEVSGVEKNGKVITHAGKIKAGAFKKNDLIEAKIDSTRRLSIARNHTATHLLQAALRKILGAHVQQQGSLVDSERLRFDFTHFKDIGKEELSRIEDAVNSCIMGNYPVNKKELSLAQAKRQGALAFFAEKYEDKVRVVSIGEISKELCGGTHLDSTGSIGAFKITQEGSVSSGVRRIEALTGEAAYKKIKEDNELVWAVSQELNTPRNNILRELEKKLLRIKELEKQLNAQGLKTVEDSVEALVNSAQKIGEIKFITNITSGQDISLLRKSVDLIKQKTDASLIALATVLGNRCMLILGLTNDLCEKGMDAAALISQVSPIIGGSGGGRKDFAQAGGSKPENLEQAFAKLKDIITVAK